MSLPKYYDNLLEQLGEDLQDRKLKRMKSIDKAETSTVRLRTKEKVKIAQLTNLNRNLEDI